MTTVKVKFRASSVENKEGALYYQVIHNRVARQVNSGLRIYASEWDADTSEVVIPSEIGNARRCHLISVREALCAGLVRFDEIVERLERTNARYTSDKVVELYVSPDNCGGFVSFAKTLIQELEQVGKRCTAEKYATALNSFVRFNGDCDLLFHEFDSKLMLEYEAFLRNHNICSNSISFYMRNLRAIYNRAVDKSLVVQRNPFKHVYTGIDRTVKRAVSLKVVRKIRDADFSVRPDMDYARNMFMFLFYTRGMSFVDMAYLKKRDLQNGVLSYRRQKTGQQLFIKWERPMQEIVDKYDTNDSPYLLPIIKNINKDARRQYRNALHFVNEKLKVIGELMGLNIPLTTYVARHTWASIARSKNIPLSIISEAMGHDSENTTRIYLASLDTSVIDRANNLILNAL